LASASVFQGCGIARHLCGDAVDDNALVFAESDWLGDLLDGAEFAAWLAGDVFGGSPGCRGKWL